MFRVIRELPFLVNASNRDLSRFFCFSCISLERRGFRWEQQGVKMQSDW
jgi:hypothetical protein